MQKIMAKKKLSKQADAIQLNLFESNDSDKTQIGMIENKGTTEENIEKVLHQRTIPYAVDVFVVDGKLDISGVMEAGKTEKLADAFFEDFKKQKQRKTPYLYASQLEEFLSQQGFYQLQKEFINKKDKLKKVFEYIREPKVSTHFLDKKKFEKYLIGPYGKLTHNTYLRNVFQKLLIFPPDGKLYNRFYDGVVTISKHPPTVQAIGWIVDKNIIQGRIKNLCKEYVVDITDKELEHLTNFVYDLDIFKEQLTTTDFNSLSKGLKEEIKNHPDWKEINILNLGNEKFSRYLASMYISYIHTRAENDDSKDQAIQRMFQEQFLKFYNSPKQKNTKKQKTQQEAELFSQDEIKKIKLDLQRITNEDKHAIYQIFDLYPWMKFEDFINFMHDHLEDDDETLVQYLADLRSQKLSSGLLDALKAVVQKTKKYLKAYQK